MSAGSVDGYGTRYMATAWGGHCKLTACLFLPENVSYAVSEVVLKEIVKHRATGFRGTSRRNGLDVKAALDSKKMQD